MNIQTPSLWAYSHIAPIVEAECHVSEGLLLGRSRQPAIVKARQWLYWALRQSGLSYPEVGKLTGRHHSTIFTGISTINRQINSDLDDWERSERIREAIENIRV